MKIALAAVCLGIPRQVLAENRDLIYTYFGPAGGAGFNLLKYSDWNNLYNKNNYSDYYATGGIAFLFNTTYNSILFIEGSFMYGWYGMGDRSTTMFYGLTLGFIYKVGRI